MDLVSRSLVDAVRHLAAREISSVELVEALRQRAARVEPKISGFAEALHDRALEAAKVADEARRRGESMGPLHGIPVTLAENISLLGHDVTLGIRARRGRPAEEDAVVVKVLKRAGALVLGRSNVSQALLFHETANPLFGRTNNPWSAERVAGGASGGEAALVASGASLAGVGTDLGGSIRVPAAFAGIAGLKPTRDRWSNRGCVRTLPGEELVRAQVGPLARSARDLALLMRALDSPIHAAFDPSVPPLLTLDPTKTDPSLLRIGWYDDDRLVAPSEAVRRAVSLAVDALKGAGARVTPFEPVSSIELTFLFFSALASDGGRTLEALLEGDPLAEDLAPVKVLARTPALVRKTLAAFLASQGEARLERLVQVTHERSVADYWALARRREELVAAVTAAWDKAGLDAIVCPAHATPALLHGQSRDVALAASYAVAYDVLGFPAGVVPVGRVRPEETARALASDRIERAAALAEQGSAGLPLAVQVVARPYREDVVLAAMIAIEDARKKSGDYPITPVTPAGV